jgi:hypothetical protein
LLAFVALPLSIGPRASKCLYHRPQSIPYKLKGEAGVYTRVFMRTIAAPG